MRIVAQINKEGFNPRTYIRYDIDNVSQYFYSFVSIHVPI